MIKKTKSISINILTAVVILFSFLLATVGVGHAWFTSENHRGIQIVIDIGQLNLKLYENSIKTENQVFTNNTNESLGSAANYIDLNGKLMPDTNIPLNLFLTNEDEGAGVYVRFSLKLVACKVTEDIEIPIEITIPTDSNIVKDGNYYYYTVKNVDNEGKIYRDSTKDILFEKPEDGIASIKLTESFSIPFSSFENSNIHGGETVKLLLNVEGSSTGF